MVIFIFYLPLYYMVSFAFSPEYNSQKEPILIPLFRESASHKQRRPLRDLSSVQKRAVRRALASNHLPKSGSMIIFSKEAPVILQFLANDEAFTMREALEAGENICAIAKRYQFLALNISKGALTPDHWRSFQEGICLGCYEFAIWKGIKYKEEKKKQKPLEKISFIEAKNQAWEKRLNILVRAVQHTKDLINDPPQQTTPSLLARLSREFAQELPHTTVEILEEKELKKLGCGGLIAVGQGSDEESRLIILNYKGGKSSEAPLALVGKGVTYDTGGLSLKPAQYMTSMKQDLGGAATILGAFWALANSGVKKNIIAVIPTAENLINHNAYKPDDVIKMYNGVTVEVTNTDAEGRLILGDAMAYAEEKFKPRAMVDLATLTGACEYAVGDDYAAILGTDQKLLKALKDAGDRTGELLWELPLHQRYKSHLDSPIADIVNSTRKLKAGTIEAALFLQHFVTKKTPWCHIDIASVTFDNPKGFATGRNVRMLWDFVERF